jgi:phospholipid-binding lipoprotein MlaA
VFKKILFITAIFLFNSNIYSLSSETYDSRCSDIYDPLEKINRATFIFNGILDYFTLRPLAKLYDSYVPERLQDGFANILETAKLPVSSINYTAQLNFENTLLSFWQFTINTLLGFGGTQNIAQIAIPTQTISNTLGYYGVGPGPYIVLPFVGSKTLREIPDLFVPRLFSLSKYTETVFLHQTLVKQAIDYLPTALYENTPSLYTILSMTHTRAAILPFSNQIAKTSIDPYVTLRTVYHQRQESTMNYPSQYKCKK